MNTEREYWHYDLPDAIPKHPLDYAMEMEVGKALVDAFPKAECSWYVEANHRTGLLRVEIPELHRMGNASYGFMLPLDKLTDAMVRRREVILAGGELLERAFVSRTTGIRSTEQVDRS